MTASLSSIPGFERLSGIPLYVPGKPIQEVQRELGLTRIVKIAPNENTGGPTYARKPRLADAPARHDDAGQRVPLDDPQAAALRALYAQAMSHADARQRAAMFSSYGPVFGDLAGRRELVDALAPALQALQQQGAQQALATLAH